MLASHRKAYGLRRARCLPAVCSIALDCHCYSISPPPPLPAPWPRLQSSVCHTLYCTLIRDGPYAFCWNELRCHRRRTYTHTHSYARTRHPVDSCTFLGFDFSVRFVGCDYLNHFTTPATSTMLSRTRNGATDTQRWCWCWQAGSQFWCRC